MSKYESTNVSELIEQRKNIHGSYANHSAKSQELKEVLYSFPEWKKLSTSQKESLDMIMHKIARIFNGDPNYIDNWLDIGGYAQLIVNELKDKETTQSLKEDSFNITQIDYTYDAYEYESMYYFGCYLRVPKGTYFVHTNLNGSIIAGMPDGKEVIVAQCTYEGNYKDSYVSENG